MQFMMPEKPISPDAEVAVILGLHQSLGGPFKLVYLFRRLRCLHIYECVSQGREWWYSLHLTTDYRFAMRELQPSTDDRRVSTGINMCESIFFTIVITVSVLYSM